MTSVTQWQSVRISTVSTTCKTTFYLSLSSIRTTIHHLLLHINVKMPAYLQSAVNACICCLSLVWPLQPPCHATGCIPYSVVALSFSSTFPCHKITSLPFQTGSVCLYSSQFTLQHHTVKSQSNDFQWNTFTVWRVNLRKLSSETPLNSEVQIYQRFWGICCLHNQGSFTLILKMQVPQSSEMLVITYGIPHQNIIRVFINNKAQTLFKFPWNPSNTIFS